MFNQLKTLTYMNRYIYVLLVLVVGSVSQVCQSQLVVGFVVGSGSQVCQLLVSWLFVLVG